MYYTGVLMLPKIRMCQVEKVFNLGLHVKRIQLGGHSLYDFPVGQESAHVKVFIPHSEHQIDEAPLNPKSLRSYTVRAFDPKHKILTIDFSIGTHQGRYSRWAEQAKAGDSIGILGPGPKKHTHLHADWHLFVTDLTGLPAVAATLEQLPKEAKGHAIIQVPQAEDIQELNKPKGVQVKWLTQAFGSQNILLEHLKKLPWPAGEPAIFLAGEKNQISQLKNHVAMLPGFNKNQLYASGYWTYEKNS